MKFQTHISPISFQYFRSCFTFQSSYVAKHLLPPSIIFSACRFNASNRAQRHPSSQPQPSSQSSNPNDISFLKRLLITGLEVEVSIGSAKVGDEAIDPGAGVLGRGLNGVDGKVEAIAGVDACVGMAMGGVARNLSSSSSSPPPPPPPASPTTFVIGLAAGYPAYTSFPASLKPDLVSTVVEVFDDDESDLKGSGNSFVTLPISAKRHRFPGAELGKVERERRSSDVETKVDMLRRCGWEWEGMIRDRRLSTELR